MAVSPFCEHLLFFAEKKMIAKNSTYFSLDDG